MLWFHPLGPMITVSVPIPNFIKIQILINCTYFASTDLDGALCLVSFSMVSQLQFAFISREIQYTFSKPL